MKKEKLSAASKSKLEAETKSNTELIDELIFMTSHSSVDDLDAEKVTAYLETLDERAPIDEPLGENEADAWKRVLERTAVADSLTDEVPRKKEHKSGVNHLHKIIGRTLLVAVIIVAVLYVVALANGINPVESVIKWTGDLIFFARNPSGELELPESNEADYYSLREALDANGMDRALCPKWIPQDYSFDGVNVKSTTRSSKVTAYYVADRGVLSIVIMSSSSEAGVNAMESEDTDYLPYEIESDIFYISTNISYIRAYAEINSFRIELYGTLSEDEVKLIIQSLYR